MPKIHSHWPIGDPLAESLAENMPSWLVLNPQPITVLICSLFGRENGHVLLMCSSLSTAQLDSHRQTQQPLASSEASLGGNDFQMAWLIDMVPENRPSQNESSLPTINFQVLC